MRPIVNMENAHMVICDMYDLIIRSIACARVRGLVAQTGGVSGCNPAITQSTHQRKVISKPEG